MKLGYQRELLEDDLYKVTPTEESQALGQKLQVEWKKELEKVNDGKKGAPNLTRALLRAFKRDILLVAFLPFLEECIFKYVILLSICKIMERNYSIISLQDRSAALFGTASQLFRPRQ